MITVKGPNKPGVEPGELQKLADAAFRLFAYHGSEANPKLPHLGYPGIVNKVGFGQRGASRK